MITVDLLKDLKNKSPLCIVGRVAISEFNAILKKLPELSNNEFYPRIVFVRDKFLDSLAMFRSILRSSRTKMVFIVLSGLPTARIQSLLKDIEECRVPLVIEFDTDSVPETILSRSKVVVKHCGEVRFADGVDVERDVDSGDRLSWASNPEAYPVAALFYRGNRHIYSRQLSIDSLKSI